MYSKTIIITGASRGIGNATATMFAAHKCNLILTCKNNINMLNEFSNSLIKTYGIECHAYKCDGSSVASVDEFFNNASQYLPDVDAIINNAGISKIGLLQDMSYDDWNEIVSSNLSAAFYMSKNIIPYFLKSKSGKIINISSVWGNVGASCEVAYSATKGGINSFTKALAKELAPSNIQVNAVAFGAIDTEMNKFLSDDERTSLEDEIPAGRMAAPKEAAEMIYDLVNAPSYLTGQVISFDGGWI